MPAGPASGVGAGVGSVGAGSVGAASVGAGSVGAASVGPAHRARFDELSACDLYDLLALRVRVFVVEQECAFQEIDGRDAEPGAEHWWTRDASGAVSAYLRVLTEPGECRIGRVVTSPEHRGTGAGAALMRAALAGIDDPVVLGAQVRAAGFYEKLGFAVDGAEYDEDGIPHVPMRRPARGAHGRFTGASQPASGSSTV